MRTLANLSVQGYHTNIIAHYGDSCKSDLNFYTIYVNYCCRLILQQ